MNGIEFSSYSLYKSFKTQRSDVHLQLVNSQNELSSGRVVSVPVALGERIGNLRSLESRIESVTAITLSNEVAAARLTLSEAALSGLSEAISDYRQVLMSAKAGAIDSSRLVEESARSFLGISDHLNTRYAGGYLFSGIQSDQPAVRPRDGKNSRLQIENSFHASFGMGMDDPRAADIAPDALGAWLDGDFRSIFDETRLENARFGASASIADIRIGERAFVKSGISANSPDFRKLIMAFELITEFGASKAGGVNMDLIIDKAIEVVDQAAQGVFLARSEIGGSLSQIQQSSKNLSLQKDIYQLEAGRMTEVDPFALSVRIGQLQTQLAASYSITARLSELALSKLM